MGNSKRSREQRRARTIVVKANRFPPGHLKICEAAIELADLPWSSGGLSQALYEESYQFAVALQPGRHGSWNAYSNWYCRCPLCRWANAKKVAERRADVSSNVEDE